MGGAVLRGGGRSCVILPFPEAEDRGGGKVSEKGSGEEKREGEREERHLRESWRASVNLAEV